jgi:hypothetical protein
MDIRKVFINCPFDNAYFPLLKSILFTILYCDKEPLIAITNDSGEHRLAKLVRMMKSASYSIHDISRVGLSGKNRLPRMNMPFECGVDFGLRYSDTDPYHLKKFLILDSEPHRYKRVISDISGHDIMAHNDEPVLAMKSVRDWLKPTAPNIPLHLIIWDDYNEFRLENGKYLERIGYDPDDMKSLPIADLIFLMGKWIRENRNTVI